MRENDYEKFTIKGVEQRRIKQHKQEGNKFLFYFKKNGKLYRKLYTAPKSTPLRMRENRMEHKVSDEAIERALSHKFGNSVTQAYNRSSLEQEFKVLYQWWSDYLEALLKENTI